MAERTRFGAGWAVAFGMVAVAIPGAAAPAARPSVAEVQRRFASPPADSRPMVRWWWFGPSVTTLEIDAEMRRMKEGGYGGFELAFVYPMAKDDPARGLVNEGYLSKGALDKVRFTSRRARELGLRMDVTIGSGWSFGGPHITRDLAAARLRSDRREITPDVKQIARPAPMEGDRLIAAYLGRGSGREVDPASFQRLDLAGDGPIRLPEGDGPRLVLFYFASTTGQVVKRAAVGAEGYVLDHYSRAAAEAHLRVVGDALMDAVEPGSVYSVFCDSLEVYEADWTPDFALEFQKRRGYDLFSALPFLEYERPEVRDRALLFRRDYGRTLTELYEERFLVPMRDWAKRRGVRFRIQNYGEPPASLSSARHADLIDGEGWNFRLLTSSRWAASAARLFGKPVVTSETWTWLRSPAFRATPLDIKGEADQHFLSGINQLIGHGWPYSPPEAGKPGWPFYAAAVLTDQNPWWPVMPDLAAYLHRLSFLLRQGEPVREVALYAPSEDAWSTFRPDTPRYLNLFMKSVEWIGPKTVPAILEAGHGFDVIDDGTLAEAAALKYRAIVLPGVRWMPEATKRWLADYAKAGGTVIAAGRVPEGGGLSVAATPDDDLTRALAAAVPPDVALQPAEPAVGFVHRRLADGDVYFLANTANQAKRVRARFRDHAPNAELLDPFTGAAVRAVAPEGEIVLDFEAYGSRVVLFRKTAGRDSVPKAPSVVAEEELRDGWTVALGAAAPRPVALPHSWSADANDRFFSGTAAYRRVVRLPPAFREAGARVVLDLGTAPPAEREVLPGGTLRGNSFAALVTPPVREAATVFVNGRRAGSLWAPPYRLDVTPYLRDGENELRLEVYNTAINTLAEGGRLPDMKTLNERYGLRTRLQDLDGLQPLPSGLVTVPRLVLER